MSYPPNYPRGYPPQYPYGTAPAPGGYYPPPAGYYPPPAGQPPATGYYPPPQPGQPPASGYYPPQPGQPPAQPRPPAPGYTQPGYPPAGGAQPRPPVTNPYPAGQAQPQYPTQYGEAYYYVKSKLNGLVLDVQGGTARPGVHVITWNQKPEAEANNQLWHQDLRTGTLKSKLAPNLCLTPTGDGLTLQEEHPGQIDQQMTVSGDRIHLRNDLNRVLDIVGGNRSPGAKITIYQYTGQDNQKWEFIRAGAAVGQPTYPSPAVVPSPSPAVVIKPSAPVVVPPPAPEVSPAAPTPSGPSAAKMMAGAVAAGAAAGAAAANAQKEKEEKKIDKRPFFIKTDLGDKVMDVKGASRDPGAHVIIYDRSADVPANQLWYLDEKGILRSKLNMFVIDTSSGKARMQPAKPGDPDQQWYLDGRKILNKARPNQCLDVKKAKCKNNQSVVPYAYTAKSNQHWTIDYINI